MIYVVRCIIELTSPLFSGSNNDLLLDNPVSRDAYGLWRLNGSSLAGILRDRVEKTLGKEAETQLFGRAHKELDSASRVWCSDVVLLDYDGSHAWKHFAEGKTPVITSPSFVRDHVRINLDLGTADNSAKFDMEYIPSGTRFAFEICLDGWQESLPKECVQWFEQLIIDVKQGKIQLGGKVSSGYGQYSMIECQGRFYNLQNESDMVQWLNLSDGPLFIDDSTNKWEINNDFSKQNFSDGLTGCITVPIKNKGPLLIGGGMGTSADMCFATTAFCNQAEKKYENKYVLPATSVKGVLRHRVYYILQSLCIEEVKAENILNGLFGFVNFESNAKSKVIVKDATLEVKQNAEKVVQHVAIDRFTGGAMDAHLFNEAPLWVDDIFTNITVQVENLTDFEAAILSHALLDLVQGRISIGSGDNRGNGRFEQNTSLPIIYSFQKGNQTVSENTAENLESWIKDFNKALSLEMEG